MRAWLVCPGCREGLRTLRTRVVGGMPGDPESSVSAWLVWQSEA